MAATSFGRGWNPARGWDNGGAPPGFPTGGMSAVPGGFPVAANPYLGGSNTYGFPGAATPMMSFPGYACGQMGYRQVGYGQAPYHPSYGTFPNPPVYAQQANGFQQPVPVFPTQPPRYPGAHPVVNPDCPALNLQNSTGGAGCEPGYNYYFPAEHTKIHVIKSSEPPWRLPAGMSMSFGAYHVPANTTIAELMKGFGATNPTPKKNHITEVIQGGNGRWYKGMTFSGDDKSEIKQMLKEVGWDATRTGRPGEKPVVWVWVTKD